jgi:AraC-like DNA-binding protein
MIQERHSPSVSPIYSDRTDTQATMSAIEAVAVQMAACLRPLATVVRDRRLRRVLALIESRPTSSVRELALEARMSPAHLQRLFKRETGLYISLPLSEHRLQRAVHLLAASDLQIKEIAYAVGYEHHSSFVRAFRRRFAHSPKQYRLRGDATAQEAK